MDRYNLQRFVDAQEGSYVQALDELQAGRKRTHWIWFIFPQLTGLGTSAMSRHYGITNFEEAKAYVDHELLGPRLNICTLALLSHPEKSATEILGLIDATKVQSSMTLFDAVGDTSLIFRNALMQLFQEVRDRTTDIMIGN